MVKIDWVEIPSGEFLMGLSEKQKETIRMRVRARYGVDQLVDGDLRAQQRVVKLDTFYIARFPVTEGQWAEHSASRPWLRPGDGKNPR